MKMSKIARYLVKESREYTMNLDDAETLMRYSGMPTDTQYTPGMTMDQFMEANPLTNYHPERTPMQQKGIPIATGAMGGLLGGGIGGLAGMARGKGTAALLGLLGAGAGSALGAVGGKKLMNWEDQTNREVAQEYLDKKYRTLQSGQE